MAGSEIVTQKTETGGSGERVTLAAVALSAALAPLNSTMIAVALPKIVEDLDASYASATWLVTAYLVVMASTQPLAGKLGDSMGRRRLILGGLMLFGVVSAGAAAAPNVWVALVFRIGQALAVSLTLSNGVAVMRQVVPAHRRGRTFGMVDAVMGLSAAAGPFIGGLLITTIDWRAIFAINVPVVLVALALAWKSLPRDSRAGIWEGFDYRGALLLPATLVSVAFFFLSLSRGGAIAVTTVAGLAAVALGAALFRLELAHSDPVLQPRLFKIRGFAAPSAGVATSNLAMYSLLLVVPLLLTTRGTHNELTIGLILSSLSVGMALMTPVGGRLADRFGRRGPALAGLSLAATATLLPAVTGSGIGVYPLVMALGFFGLGIGISSAGMRTSAVESINLRNAGAAAGVYSTSRYFGSIVGSTVLAGLIGVDRSDTNGVSQVFIVVAVMAAAAAVAALFMVARPAVED